MRSAEGRRACVRRYSLRGVLLLASLLPSGLSAQGPRFLRDTTFPGDPIQVLLDRTGELRLSPEQTSQLKEVQQQLHATNDPLVARLVTIRHQVRTRGHPRDMSPAQRDTFQAAVQRARPIMQAIGRNNYQAMQQVGALLTPAQKELVRGWLQHPAPAPGLMPHGGPGRGAGPGTGAGPGRRFRGDW